MFIKSELDYLEQEEVGEVTSISGIINQGWRGEDGREGTKSVCLLFPKEQQQHCSKQVRTISKD